MDVGGKRSQYRMRIRSQWEEILEKGMFGIFFLFWIFVITYLVSQSEINPYFNGFESQLFMKENYYSYETFANKTAVGGPYRVYKSTIYIGGFVCGRSQNAIVYYPESHDRSFTRKFPLISFAHGFRAGGQKLDKDYSKLLVGLASWGFIVIAPESAPTSYCEEQYEDQLRVFDYVQSNRRKNKAFASLDSLAYYGVLGHSMGGRSSIISATKDDYPIGAAAALNPVYTQATAHIKVCSFFLFVPE